MPLNNKKISVYDKIIVESFIRNIGPFLMGLSIHLNQNGIEKYILGTENFYAYSFISSEQGFEVLFGPGIIVIGILGGLLSVIVHMVSKKLFHSSLNN